MMPSPTPLSCEAICSALSDTRRANIQLPVLKGEKGGGERVWNIGQSLSLPHHNTWPTTPDNSRGIVKACLCLHNVMRMRYPNLQNAVIDTEGTDGEIILELGETAMFCRTWRKPIVLPGKPVRARSCVCISNIITTARLAVSHGRRPRSICKTELFPIVINGAFIDTPFAYLCNYS